MVVGAASEGCTVEEMKYCYCYYSFSSLFLFCQFCRKWLQGFKKLQTFRKLSLESN